jgi:hypothetical protein
MKNNFENGRNENNAQGYYPTAITLDKNSKITPAEQQNNSVGSPFSVPFSALGSLFSQPNVAELLSKAGLSTLLSSANKAADNQSSGNSFLSSILGKSTGQGELLSNLLSTFAKKSDSADSTEKTVDISNSIDEF